MSQFGPSYERTVDGKRLRTQMDWIRCCMLEAERWGRWLTLREIARMTRYPEASISAQLRHLRKPQFGGYVLEKRRRGDPKQGLWEYQLHRLQPAQGFQFALIPEELEPTVDAELEKTFGGPN